MHRRNAPHLQARAFSFDSAGISARRNSIPQRSFTLLRLPAASAIRP